MNFKKVKQTGIVVAVVVILICAGIFTAASLLHKNTSAGVSSTNPQGYWVQTSCYELDNVIDKSSSDSNNWTFVKKDDVHSEYNFTIENYGDHYAKITQDGVVYIGVRLGSILMWDYTSTDGSERSHYTHVEAVIYTDCMLVNEIIYTTDDFTSRIIVTSSLYTRDGVAPGWFTYPAGGAQHLKWNLSSAYYMSTEKSYMIDGRNLNFNMFYGPTFLLEMEQQKAGTKDVETVRMCGQILGNKSDGAFTAIALDETGKLWYIYYNGSVMSMESLYLSDGAFGAAVERNYDEISDSAPAKYSEGAIALDSEWHFHSAYKVTKDGITEVPVSGNYKVEHVQNQMFSLTDESTGKVTFAGYSMPTLSNPNVHFLGIGAFNDSLSGVSTAYGTYNAENQNIRFIVFGTDSEGNSYAVEYFLHSGTD